MILGIMKFTCLAWLYLSVMLVSANYGLLEQQNEEATSLSIAIIAIMEEVSIESNRMDIRIYGTALTTDYLN